MVHSCRDSSCEKSIPRPTHEVWRFCLSSSCQIWDCVQKNEYIEWESGMARYTLDPNTAWQPYQIFYKYSHNDLESWKILDVRRKNRGGPSDPGMIVLPQLRAGPRSIQPKKLKDLMELLDYIPPVYQAFYTALESSTTTQSGNETESDSDWVSTCLGGKQFTVDS